MSVFHACQHLGVDVLPRHFYSEIPDVRKLRRTTAWRKPFSFIGVAGANLDDQLAFVRSTVGAPEAQREDVYARACESNGEAGYGPVEADFLYAFVRTHQPRRIVQIGCGVSTALCLAAAAEAGYRPEVTAIDPFPTPYLRRLAANGTITLLAQPVESLRHDDVLVLEADAGDLFFVDSTHTLGPAGEVSRIILELLPRLDHGTFVHFHDIYFPYDYPGETLTTSLFFPHESVLLHAFLVNNPRYAIAASLSMLHHARSAELAALLPRYAPRPSSDGLAAGPGHFPSSAFLKVMNA